MWKLWLTFAWYSQKQLQPAGRTQNLSIVGDDKSQLVTEFTERHFGACVGAIWLSVAIETTF